MASPAMGMGMQVVGAGVNMFGSIYKGTAESDMYKYQAGVSSMNEKLALENAKFARAAGEVEAQRSGMATRYKLGLEKAGQGASGIALDTGTSAKVRESELAIGQQDEAMIRSNAARKAYGYDVAAASAKAEAGVEKIAAENAEMTGYINAFSSLLGGASSVNSKWQEAKKYGMNIFS